MVIKKNILSFIYVIYFSFLFNHDLDSYKKHEINKLYEAIKGDNLRNLTSEV